MRRGLSPERMRQVQLISAAARVTDPAVRFASKFEADPNSGCWLWTGALSSAGYGSFLLGDRVVLAHRASYALHREDPVERQVLHRCDTPYCVNPNHLFLGDHSANMADMVAKGRHGFAKRTHCPQGHPYDATNTYTKPRSGARTCRACTNAASRAHRARKRARAA